uniref:Uncharacterized protein n=1 Tax=Kalanchoe fedtschenkoi TaxID=63787 RepID=A0A7N0UYG9_KALFE
MICLKNPQQGNTSKCDYPKRLVEVGTMFHFTRKFQQCLLIFCFGHHYNGKYSK